jgi:hypothetical protein
MVRNLLALALVLGLTACSGNTQMASLSQNEVSNDWWNNNYYAMIGYGQPQTVVTGVAAKPIKLQ